MQRKNNKKIVQNIEKPQRRVKISILVTNSFKNSYSKYQFQEFLKIKVNMSYVNRTQM